MADGLNSLGPSAPPRPQTRPTSPHLSIYAWSVTMAASITHRATGLALSAGTLLVAWWLWALAGGPDSYDVFLAAARHPAGQIVLFGFTWSLAFHLLNGIRHLAWDFGYGFAVKTARLTGALVYAGSLLSAAALFGWAYFGGGGG